MRKEDYIKKIMTLSKQFEFKVNNKEKSADSMGYQPEGNWQELVEFATNNGLDKMEIQDLIQMAALAKEVLEDKAI